MPRTRASAATSHNSDVAEKPSEPEKPMESEEQVDLDGDNDPEETMEEEVEYEEVEEEEEVEEVEEEEEEIEEGLEEEVEEDEEDKEATKGADEEMKVDQAEEDERKKHSELLSLPPHGSEVYLGNIPHDSSEENVKGFCESIGEVTEVRIMKGKDSGGTKAYAFVTFRTKELASRAIEELNNSELKGKKVKCSASQAKHRLFIGNVPRNWGEADMKKAVTEIGPGVISVELLTILDPHNSSRYRGFAFIEYHNNACAEYSRQKMSNPQFKLDKNAPTVSWADPKNATSSAASQISEYVEHNDAILLVVIPATQAPEISSSRALKIVKEFDAESTRTVGIISKIDQAASEPKALAAVQALLLNQGPPKTSDIPWVALIGQSVSIASAQSGAGSENSLETAWRAESESLKSILTGAPQSKLGRVALVEALAGQIRNRMKLRLPNLLSGLQGKSQFVQDELVRLGEQMVNSAEGTRAIALQLCREFEDKFLLHITGGEGSGWKVVASFEGNFPNRIKQLPLDRHFDINNVKRIVLEADGYQPYLISPEKGLRSLIKGVLELAKEPSRLCVEEVHRVLVEIVSAAASATPGLGRYPPFKREVVAVASAALDEFKNEAKKMVIALVDMERAFVPPQHFIRLVQRRMDRQRREEELKNRPSKRAPDAEQSILNRATSPQTGEQTGGSLKSMKEKSGQQEKDVQEGSALKTAGPAGEIIAGFLLKKSAKTNGWSRRWFVFNGKTGKLGYTKKQEERDFRGVITLEECNIEEISDEEEAPSKGSKNKKANGPDSKKPSLVFKLTSKIPYKTVLKAHSAVVLKAESVADKVEWLNRLRSVAGPYKGGEAKGESGFPMRHSFSDGSLDSMVRKPADPEEELRWMSQEVRGYVEAVLNSLAANVPKAVVLCQVEKAKEDMLNQLYSSISALSTARIEELIQEDQNVKHKRERIQRQSSLLSKLTRQLSIHDNRAAAASSWSNGGGGAENSPRTTAPPTGDDWRSAFDAAANGSVDSYDDSSRFSRGHSRRYSDPAQNGDSNSSSSSNSSSRRTPNRLPPAPPQSGYK